MCVWCRSRAKNRHFVGVDLYLRARGESHRALKVITTMTTAAVSQHVLCQVYATACLLVVCSSVAVLVLGIVTATTHIVSLPVLEFNAVLHLS